MFLNETISLLNGTPSEVWTNNIFQTRTVSLVAQQAANGYLSQIQQTFSGIMFMFCASVILMTVIFLFVLVKYEMFNRFPFYTQMIIIGIFFGCGIVVILGSINILTAVYKLVPTW